MSKGAGVIGRRITDLLAETRDRLSIDDTVDHAYELGRRCADRRVRLHHPGGLYGAPSASRIADRATKEVVIESSK